MGDNVNSSICRKAIIIGDTTCGKTCLLHTFHMGKFPDEGQYIPTVFEGSIAEMKVNDQTVQLVLWDTAGHYDFNRLRYISYPDSAVVIICFSIGAPESLDTVGSKWVEESSAQVPDAPVVLVGLKLDLRNDQRTIDRLAKYRRHPVTRTEGKRVAKKIGADAYIEVSSMQNLNVRQVFELAARAAVIPKGKKKGNMVSTDCCVIL